MSSKQWSPLPIISLLRVNPTSRIVPRRHPATVHLGRVGLLENSTHHVVDGIDGAVTAGAAGMIGRCCKHPSCSIEHPNGISIVSDVIHTGKGLRVVWPIHIACVCAGVRGRHLL